MIRFLLILIFFVPKIAFAQITIQGTVTDDQGEAVFAANVFLKNNTDIGTTTDFDGKFSITFQKDQLPDTLVISYIGYDKKQIPVAGHTKNISLDIYLQQQKDALLEVLIKAKRPVSEQFAVKSLDKLEIYTSPLAQADPLKAITALPASTNTDESANPALRGSNASRSLVVFNKVPVQSPVRNSQINGIGFFSLLNPEIIKEQFVYASNPPLTYGNSSAGLVEIETNDKLSTSSTQIATGLASLGVFTSQQTGENTFVQAYGNYQFSDLFIGLNESTLPDLESFGNIDFGINFRTQLDEANSINFFSYTIDENYEARVRTLNFDGITEGRSQRNFNILNWENQAELANTSINLGWDQNSSNFRLGNLHVNSASQDFYASLHRKAFINSKFVMEYGGSYNRRSYESLDSVPVFPTAFSEDAPNEFMEHKAVLQTLESFAYATYNIDEFLIFTAGLRANFLTTPYLSYQFGLRKFLNSNHSFLLSGGQYHNFSSPNFFNNQFQLLKSQQLALDYNWQANQSEIGAAVFFKKEDGEQLDNFLTTNSEEILGVEISYQQDFGKYWQLSAANTFIDQRVSIDGQPFEGSRDLDYFVKLNLSYNNPNLFSTTLSYVTRPGLRFTPIVGAAFNAEQTIYQPIYSEQPFGSRYDAYNNLSLSLSRYQTFDDQSLVLYLTITNLLNTNNQRTFYFNENYSQRGENLYQQRTIYFGVVWSIQHKNKF